MKNCKNPKKGLDKPKLLVYNKLVKIRHAPIAQLDRVFGYEPKGRGFESLLACQPSTSALKKLDYKSGFIFLF